MKATEFRPTAAHIAALRVCNAWDALCEAAGDVPMVSPDNVHAAVKLLDSLEGSELDRVAAELAAPIVSPAEFGPYSLSPETRTDLAELEISDSPYAADLARNIRDWLAGRDHAPPAVIASARLLDSNGALARAALHGRTEFLAKLAADVANVAGSMNGRKLAESEVTSASGLAGELERLARGLAESDYPESYAAVCQIGAQGVALLRTLEASKASHATCAASLAQADAKHVERAAAIRDAAALSLADRTQLRGSPFAGARILARYLAAFAEKADVTDLAGAIDAAVQLEREACDKFGQLRAADENAHAYKAQRDAESARAVKAERLAETRLAEHVAAERANLANAERADAAERQLAEYRSLMAELPAGLALRYPAALHLLRAYLADVESAK